ncbi:type IX secretion system membrane protein PorP/SprF [Aureibacter tunicatorum]|uniref:Type IX secretion system PorP/SprF family membrane protein n=1 Tax=Aureibacter tunicatorum TaxID=866807 RepID=A0AAE3XPY9_9BACT|nr:type IX secretion system membrane protein PorP/SprF [Aureibacter tunicatorum]MDR6239209.1 type IX secretion system PorP/SprF family membrane protein [Aureibacter tunicatorum]BDD04865.1 hypothetical protein AUTU_23480 [Aureibacter tunicatorum]
MKNKICTALILLVIGTINANAQDRISFKQKYQTPQVINASYAGINPYWHLDAGVGQVKYDDGLNLRNSFASFNLTYPKVKGKGSNSMRECRATKLSLKRKRRVYHDGKSRFGAGLSYHFTSLGEYKVSVLENSYALHIPASLNAMLSLGVGLGYVNQRIDIDALNVRHELDPIYQDYLAHDGNSSVFTVNVGASYHTYNAYIGLSYREKASSKGFKPQDEIFSLLNFSGGYRFLINRNIEWLNSGIFEINTLEQRFAITSQMEYQSVLRLGLTYSQNEYFTTFVGLQFADNYRFNLAFSNPLHQSHKTLIEGSLSVYFYKLKNAGQYFW